MVSHVKRRRIGAAVAAYWIGLLAFSTAPAGAVAGQAEPTAQEEALAGAVRQRFEVELRSDGLTLTSTGAGAAPRVITLGDGVVAVDGVPVSGLELRRAFGDDADLVLRVTYLGEAARRALFGGDEGDAADPAGPEQARPEEAAAAAAGEEAAATEQEAQAEVADADETAGTVEQSAAETAGAAEQTATTTPQAAASAAAGRTAADPAVESAREADDAPARRTITRRDVFRIGGPVTIERDERVRGDATVILGGLTVDGEVTGDVVAIAGPLRLGPEAVVRGDVTVVAGSLRRASSAELRGAVTQVGLGGVRGWDAGRWFQFGWPGAWPGSGLAGTSMRLMLLALLASGIVLVARGPVEGIAQRASAEPLKAGVVGVLAQMLAVPLLVSGILIAVVSIVGIPLLLLLPFTPANKENMIGWMAAHCDQPLYGRIQVYNFPKQELVYGPMQIEARITQDADIAKELTLWNQEGSQVIRGDIIVVPIQESLLYIEPLYLRQRSSRGGLPELKRVIVAYGNRIAMRETLDQALSSIFSFDEGTLARQTKSIVDGQEVIHTRRATLDELAKRAVAHFADAQNYLQTGDWSGYGTSLQQLENVLQRLSDETGQLE